MTKQTFLAALFTALLSLSAAAVFAEPVNINTADAKTMAKNLDGVGEKRAQAIVEYRKANGKFTSLKDLQKVKGIGESVSSKNEKNITF